MGGFVSSNGLLNFKGDLIPLFVIVVSGAVMAVFIWLAEKKKKQWVENFSIAGSMLIAMASAVVFAGI